MWAESMLKGLRRGIDGRSAVPTPFQGSHLLTPNGCRAAIRLAQRSHRGSDALRSQAWLARALTIPTALTAAMPSAMPPRSPKASPMNSELHLKVATEMAPSHIPALT